MDYEIPRFGTPTDKLLGWLLNAESEGRAWLQTQVPAKGWPDALQMLSGEDSAIGIEGLSNTQYKKSKRIAREIVASLSNFRHEGEFKTTWDQTLYDTAHSLTNLDRHWYRTTHANEEHRKAIQYGVATGTAYLWETWDKHRWGPHRGDIRLQAVAPQNVTFVQLPSDHDIQRAYAVIIREEMPINLARAIYGETNAAFAASLVPDRDSPSWLLKGLQKVQQFLSPALRVSGRTQKDGTGSFPTVDIFHMYTIDQSINETPAPITMGPIGINWSYTVPALGDPLPTGQINPATGEEWTRPAGHGDCLLFPLRRYTIFSNTGIAYDGSSPWWHAECPIARLRFSDWAWEALGTSLISELKSMEAGIEALMRGMEDAMACQLDTPYLYDDQMSETWAKAFNPRKAGSRARAPLSQIDPIKFPIDPASYRVSPEIPAYMQAQEDRMDYISGVRDLVAIAKAKQIPGADTLEKLLEMAGPLVQDMVRAIEEPLQKLGEWRKAYYFQFYTRPRMITITGPDGLDSDFQYQPDQLMPWLTQTKDGKLERAESPEMHAMRYGALNAQQRTALLRKSLGEFHYHVTESGVNEINRMSQLLLYIQLSKSGVLPISWWTFAKAAKVPNYGPPPEGTNTEMERVIAQQQIQADQQIELAQKLGQAQAGAQGGGQEPLPFNAPPGGQEGPGRPASFSAPPKLVSKDGGTRSTISTSR